jgi:hypothetical protein
MNLLDVASFKSAPNIEFNIYSTYNWVPVGEYVAKASNVKLSRFGLRKVNSKASRGIHYLLYYLRTLMSLLVSRPSTILYYDSISSFPAIIYKRFFNREVRLFVHYHEYMSKAEYKNGMKMVKYFHALEKKELPNVSWISHTNHERMELYEKDLFPLSLNNKNELPNYPPESWTQTEENKKSDGIVRIVQVGSIGLETMYVREFSNWVIAMKGRVIWDIYTFNLDKDTRDYFNILNSPWITIKAPVDYGSLANTLRKYDVGVILYKGHIPNYIFNAPNKLFEYHVCGLDVWFPPHMISALKYQTLKTYPKIMSVDFKGKMSDVEEYIDHGDMVYEKRKFSANEVYEPFLEKLCS